MYDKLIFGKNNTEKIVNIEVHNSTAELFIQQEDGSIKSEFASNKYWILSAYKLRSDWVRLKGNLHYKWGKQYADRSQFLADKKQFKDNQIYSIYDPKESFMVNKGYTYYKGLKPKEVSILSFDIETNGLVQNDDSFIYLISNTYRDSKGNIQKMLFRYDKYKDNGEMLEAWANWVCEINPSILCGHNILIYDLPFMAHVASLHGTTLTLGRDGSDIHFASYESKLRKDQTQELGFHNAYIYGREVIDTMFLSIKYDTATKKYDSYGLKSIIKTEGLERPGRQHYDASAIKKNHKNPIEWEKICKYAEDDSDDALALFDLMAPSYFYMTQSIPKSFQSVTQSASGSQLNSIMARSYLQEGHSLPKASDSEEYEGAISFGIPGIHKNVFKVDVSSLYPSIMLQYEVHDPDKDPERNFLKILAYFTTERLKNKKLSKDTGNQYYEDLQQSQKIFINSLYGFLGTTGLIFNSPKKAAFITAKGREILNDSIKWAEENNLTVINGDTDSISFKAKDEQDISITQRKQLLESLNSKFPEKIKFEDDGYFLKVITLKAKNYILWDGKKIKMKGSSIKDPKREPAVQEFIKDMINAIIEDNTDYLSIYNRYVNEAMSVTDPFRWSMKKTITSKVLNAERLNEMKVLDAIKGTEYVEGDKPRFYYTPEGNLKLIEHWDGKYNVDKCLEKLYNSVYVFETIMDMGQFLNYKLKRNKKLLGELNGSIPSKEQDKVI